MSKRLSTGINASILLVAVGAAAPLAAAEADDSVIRRAERAIMQDEAAEADGVLSEAETPILEGWSGSFEFGLDGSTGNTEELDIRGSVVASRETDKYITTARAGFMYGTAEGTNTDNEIYAGLRNDWKLEDPRWRVYAEGTYEYDEFQEWDHRLTVGAGVAYQAIKNDTTELILRSGIQARKDVGGSENAWVPEGVFGFDLTHSLTERQEVGVTFDFYPTLDDLGPYRHITDAYWKIDVDPEVNMFLRVGIHNEYDSDPGVGFKRNDLDYYATLGWSF